VFFLSLYDDRLDTNEAAAHDAKTQAAFDVDVLGFGSLEENQWLTARDVTS
jgi:hypothetical protein